METLRISLGDVVGHVKPWFVMELLRETIGLHTCEFGRGRVSRDGRGFRKLMKSFIRRSKGAEK